MSRFSHINLRNSSEDNELEPLSKSLIIKERRNSYLSDLDNQSLRDSSEFVKDSSVSPKEIDNGLVSDKVDINQIPMFPIDTHVDGYASCPNSVQITPSHYGAIDHLRNPRTPDGMVQHFFEEGEGMSISKNSSGDYENMEQMTDLSL